MAEWLRGTRAKISAGALAVLLCGGALLWFTTRGESAPTNNDTAVTLPEGAFNPSAVRNESNNLPPDCSAEQLRVTAHTDQSSYAADELPELTLAVENVSDSPCLRDLGTSQMVFEVQSEAVQVWRSTDCQYGADNRLVTIEPGQRLFTAPLVWERSYSAPDTCELRERESAPAFGTAYHLHVMLGDVSAVEPKQFVLY